MTQGFIARHRFLSIAFAVIIVVGAAVAVWVATHFLQTQLFAGRILNDIKARNAPAGTLTTELNPAWKPTPAVQPASAATPPAPNPATQGDWAGYNKTLTSERFADLAEINTSNVAGLKVLCTYDTKSRTSFQSGLIVVNGALIGTTYYDTFSIDPATCRENWRTHTDVPPSLLNNNRGAAYLDGKLFRGAADGKVHAFDFRTGKELWATSIADPKKAEVLPAAPIAWNGLIFQGVAGGDFKGVKGRVYALEAATGKIVWEFYLIPKQPGDPTRGPQGPSPLDTSTWSNPPGFPISGGGSWTSTSLDPATGELFVPVGNPAPDFAIGPRDGENFYTDSIVMLDARTGAYKRHFKLVPRDWHDWDASAPPALIRTAGGKSLMAVTPKDGHVYGYDRATNRLLYRVPVTKIENIHEPFAVGKAVHFCPGGAGGTEWNGPGYDAKNNLIMVGSVQWCDTVKLASDKKIEEVRDGEVWTGNGMLNPINLFGRFARADGHWAGWLHAVDADTGVWKWRVKTNYPLLAGITPTAGGLVFFADVGGNFYALDSATGQKLWGRNLRSGMIGGGVITYTAGGAQKVAVAAGMTSAAWPVKSETAKVIVLGLR
jgi:alcohol dehydrogenase (cytochrome c)